MKLLTLVTVMLSLASVSAHADSSAPLSQVLATKGSLVFLQDLKISGTYDDGTEAYAMDANYQSDASGMICDAEYSTSSNPDSVVVDVPGADANFTKGEAIAWFSGFPYDDSRFTVTDMGDGTVEQEFFLQFSILGQAKMISMDCSATTPAGTVLTVSDFETATGGMMSLESN